MSGLKVTSVTSTSIQKFIWTLKEVVVIAFNLGKQSHELELLHVKYSKEVFVLVNQRLVSKINRKEMEACPSRIEVEGVPLLLSYEDGKFKLDQGLSMMSESTRASGACTSTMSKSEMQSMISQYTLFG